MTLQANSVLDTTGTTMATNTPQPLYNTITTSRYRGSLPTSQISANDNAITLAGGNLQVNITLLLSVNISRVKYYIIIVSQFYLSLIYICYFV